MGLNKPQPLKDKIRYAEDYYTISLSSICAKQNIGGMFEIEDVANAVEFLRGELKLFASTQEMGTNKEYVKFLKEELDGFIDKAFPDVVEGAKKKEK